MSQLVDNLKAILTEKTEKIISTNIKQGVQIFDIMGTYVGKPVGGTSALGTEYQEVEYLESTGTQYIDTGVLPNANTTSAVVEFELLKVTEGKEQWALGQWYGSNGWRCGYQYVNSAVSFDKQRGFSYSATAINKRIVGVSAASSITSPYTMILFAQQEQGNIRYVETSFQRIYGCKIWEDGVPIREFVPCYRIADAEPGMYDVVNKVFYTNDGTGTFVLGPVVTDFTQLEYVENTETTQYIDTGIQALSTVGAELTVLCPNDTECTFFGAWGSSNGLLFGQAGSHWFGAECYSIATDSAWKNAPGIEFDAGWHTYKYDAITKIASVDGVATEAPANSGRNANIYIFRTNNYGTPLIGTRISSCKLYNNGELIRDYIPVKRNVDDVVCMYDLVNNEYALPSSGTFVAGPEVE